MEVVVVIAIVALFFAILVPAAQMAREASRRVDCASRLRQFGVAIHTYHSDHAMFPPGGSRGYSLHVAVLPYFGEQNLFNSVNYSAGGAAPEGVVGIADAGSTVRASVLQAFLCPSDPAARATRTDRATSYSGNLGTGAQWFGWNGFFRKLSRTGVFDHGPIRSIDITDGLSATAAMSEILVADNSRHPLRTFWDVQPRQDTLDDFAQACRQLPTSGFNDPRRGIPWTFGDVGVTLHNHILPPNSKSCMNAGSVQSGIYTAASLHKQGVNVLFGDGRVAFFTNRVSSDVWRAIGTRAGNETATF